MPDVYSRQRTNFGGSFASDVAALSIAGSLTPLGIVQNVQIQFSQQIARIYDVSNGGAAAEGQVPVFYVGGRTQGQATIARVLGPQSGALCNFYTEMGNVCSPQDLTFTFRGSCEGLSSAGGTADGVIFTVEAAVMTNLGISVGSQDMIVNENISLMFANLQCDNL